MMNKSTKEVVNFWFTMALLLATMFTTVMYIDVARRLEHATQQVKEYNQTSVELYIAPEEHEIGSVEVIDDELTIYYRDTRKVTFPLYKTSKRKYDD